MLSRLAIALAVLALLPSASPAQTRVVTCSSGGNRAFCRADLRDGVLLERQLSASICEFGDTWGIDTNSSNTIWVSRGCRGEFRVRAPTGTGGAPGYDPFVSPARETYVKGYRAGVSDKRARRRADLSRHRDQFAAAEVAHFRRGYDDGYNSRPADTTAVMNGDYHRRVHDLGVRRGADDRKYGLSSDYTRWRGDYELAYEMNFKTGYLAGFGKTTRRSGR